MSTSQLKPVGQRPRCLHCQRELRPNFRRERPPIFVPTGETWMVKEHLSWGELKEEPVTRSTTEAERKQWRKEHPAQFLGTYGDYSDNRFCGLNCGYKWAVAHSRPQV